MIQPYRKAVPYLIWKAIPGFEGIYEISDTGIVRSLDKVHVDTLGRKRFWKGKVLTPDIAPNGYYRVSFSNGRNHRVQRYLHRLLAELFIPNPDNLPQVNHKDGVKTNCSLDNLEWVSVQDNVIHAYRHGLINHISGDDHPNRKHRGSDSKNAKPVKATNIRTGESKIYGAIIETKKDGFLPCEVSRCAKHGGTHHGYVFELV